MNPYRIDLYRSLNSLYESRSVLIIPEDLLPVVASTGHVTMNFDKGSELVSKSKWT
jgi:hypothetical protein